MARRPLITHGLRLLACAFLVSVAQGCGDPNAPDPLGALTVDRVLAVGASQSAHQLATYVNAVQPLDRVYDGYLIDVRFGRGAPLTAEILTPSLLKLRSDLEVPILAVNTERRGARSPGCAPRGRRALSLLGDCGRESSRRLRLPQIAVPVARYGPGQLACRLNGSTIAFDDETLRKLYPDRERYLSEYDAAARSAIEEGFLLAEDLDEVLNEARRVEFSD